MPIVLRPTVPATPAVVERVITVIQNEDGEELQIPTALRRPSDVVDRPRPPKKWGIGGDTQSQPLGPLAGFGVNGLVPVYANVGVDGLGQTVTAVIGYMDPETGQVVYLG